MEVLYGFGSEFLRVLVLMGFGAFVWEQSKKSRKSHDSDYEYRWSCPVLECGFSASSNTEYAIDVLKARHVETHLP